MVAMAGWQPYVQHKFGRSCKLPQNKLEEPHYSSSSWYYSKKEIEENSPSRKDGIDLSKETCLRKLYCSFLQELGIKLKVPQVTIATAVMFCHRFFLGQSHAKNDWQTIATTCMFLAGKVEETPVMLRDIVVVAHSIIHKRDPVSAERIKQWETYQEKKELILLAERLLLSTVGFDFNIIHPYKPLVTAIKNLKLGQSELAKVSWNTLNDCGLRVHSRFSFALGVVISKRASSLQTTLCLQFKPAYIAAGAMYLAAKVTNFKLPSHGGKVWWQEFDVSPFQLEEVIKQMVDLFIPNGRSFSHPHPESSSKPLSNFNTAARDGLGNSSEKSSDQSQNPVSVEVHVESGRSEVQPEAQHCEDVTMETSSGSMDLLEDGPQQKQRDHQCNINGDSEMWIGVQISGVKKGNQKLSVNVINDVHKERIRAALKRRREGCAVKRAAVITNEEDDYDAWIEKELEDGIELAKPAECKLRYEEDAFDAWVEKELEDGIEMMVKPAKKKLRHQEPILDVQAV